MKEKSLLPFDLPDWFDFDSYKKCEKFNTYDWYEALQKRKELEDLLENSDYEFEYTVSGSSLLKEGEKIVEQEIRPTVTVTIKMPELFWQRLKSAMEHEREDYSWVKMPSEYRGNYFNRVFRKFCESTDSEHGNLFNRCVTPLSGVSILDYSDYYSSLSEFDGYKRDLTPNEYAKDEYTEEEEKAILKELDLTFKPLELIAIQSGEPSPETILAEIDLSCPETILVEQFREFIREYKSILEASAVNKVITPAKIGSWIEFKVLLYIDLTLIAKFYGKKITDKVMGETIFPEEYEVDPTDRVKDTVRPRAEEFMSSETINALRHQVRPKGMAKQNKKTYQPSEKKNRDKNEFFSSLLIDKYVTKMGFLNNMRVPKCSIKKILQ
jgi:Family of unknown function (DUF6387)